MLDRRGQAYTLEGLVAAVLVVASVILGLQAVDVAPWTAGPSDETIETLRMQGDDALAVAADSGMLRRAVTCLDGSEPEADAYRRDHNASAAALGPLLNGSLASRGYSYSVFLTYRNGSSTEEVFVHPESEQSPRNGVVTVSRRVVLYDSMQARTGPDCEPTGRTLGERNRSADGIYVSDEYPDSPIYNVVEVRVEAW